MIWLVNDDILLYLIMTGRFVHTHMSKNNNFKVHELEMWVDSHFCLSCKCNYELKVE